MDYTQYYDMNEQQLKTECLKFNLNSIGSKAILISKLVEYVLNKNEQEYPSDTDSDSGDEIGSEDEGFPKKQQRKYGEPLIGKITKMEKLKQELEIIEKEVGSENYDPQSTIGELLEKNRISVAKRGVYSKMTKNELLKIAKEYNIKCKTSLKKNDLIDLIIEQDTILSRKTTKIKSVENISDQSSSKSDNEEEGKIQSQFQSTSSNTSKQRIKTNVRELSDEGFMEFVSEIISSNQDMTEDIPEEIEA
jgi:hypothetical protein